MEKGACVHLVIFLWTILACLINESSAGRGVQWNRNGEQEEKKSIMCYKCNSAYDPNCGDPFEPYSIGVVDCSIVPIPEHLDQNLTATICRKSVQKVYGKIRIVRDCGYLRDVHDDKECVKRSGTHDVQVLYCSCTTPLCNASHNIHSIPIPILFSSVLLLTLFTTRKTIS